MPKILTEKGAKERARVVHHQDLQQVYEETARPLLLG